MYKFLIKNGQGIALGVGIAVVAIFLISVMTGLSGAGYDMSTDLNKLTSEQKADIGFFNLGLGLTIALVVIALVLAFVVFGLADLIKFPKSAMKIGLGFVVLAVIFFIVYSTASGEATGDLGETLDKFQITPNVSKFISAGMFTTIGLLVLSVAAIVLGEL